MAAVVTAATLVAGGLALASSGGQRVGTPSPKAGIVQHSRGVSAVAVATSDFNDVSNSSTTLNLIPGMKTRIFVPTGTQALLDIRFSAETACYGGGTSPNWCVAEILVDGVEASPGDGTDFALDSTDNGTESSASWESHAMERAIVVGEGFHVVKVIGGVTDFTGSGTQTFWTGERTLVVQRSLI